MEIFMSMILSMASGMKRTFIETTTLKRTKSDTVDVTSFFKKIKPDNSTQEPSTVEETAKEKREEHLIIGSKEVIDSKFDKQKWLSSLQEDQKLLLDLEITTLHESWLLILHKELTKPYFLKLKEFVLQEQKINKIFPPSKDIYSWSRLTPLNKTKVLIIGQDPYHNDNQAHGLAFSVIDPNTKIPPSLQNIYKAILVDYPDFKIPKKNANLTPWATDGVLMLNTCLTVKAHNANSHSKKGWETFTRQVVAELIRYKKRQDGEKLCIMCWGGPLQKLLSDIKKTSKDMEDESILILKSCHPSPLSAYRGDFFHCGHFKACNDWLGSHDQITWTGVEEH